mgnify:CR=1 FL=1
MRIYTCYLGSHVCAQAQRAARQLVDQFKGTQIHVMPRTGQQGVQILKHRRHDKFVPVKVEVVENDTT